MNDILEPKIRVEEAYRKYFSETAQGVYCAPGRVNLIGEHTDYNDGFVLPAAIQYHTAIAAGPREDNIVEALALDHNAQRVSIDLNQVFENNREAPWSDYLTGVIKEMLSRGHTLKGMNLVISGNVPQGAGLSSSASFEIAIAAACSALNKLALSGREAALIGQAAENNFVGCNCGIMDQLVSALGKKGDAMLLDCRTLETEYFSIPGNLSVLIVNSNVKRGLVGSEYNVRRKQCEAAAEFFEVPALRDLSIEQLEEAKGKLDEVVFRRARHIVSENTRTRHAANALAAEDMQSLSALMAESHASMRDDFDITVPAVDSLVEIISNVLGPNGGARMTGGGFGGCVVSLLPGHLVEEVLDAVSKAYKKRSGLKETIYICQSADGGFN